MERIDLDHYDYRRIVECCRADCHRPCRDCIASQVLDAGDGRPGHGEVRNVDARTKRVGGHYQCLALAFIKYDGGVLQYAHKMWAKSPDGSCHYNDVTARKVGNHGACVKDSNAGFGAAVGTARMAKDNIDYEHSIFRTIDLNTRRVGETKSCVPPKGVGAGLYSMADSKSLPLGPWPMR